MAEDPTPRREYPTVVGLMTLDDIAQEAGIEYGTLKSHHRISTKARANGERGGPNPLPAPDLVVGRIPIWSWETISPWLACRAMLADPESARRGRPPKTAASA